MPDVHALRDRFARRSVTFIAVHTPRVAQDMLIQDVRSVAARIGITEPCAIDNDRLIGDRFELSGIWPYYFLFGPDGLMKRRGAGALGLRLVTNALETLYP